MRESKWRVGDPAHQSSLNPTPALQINSVLLPNMARPNELKEQLFDIKRSSSVGPLVMVCKCIWIKGTNNKILPQFWKNLNFPVSVQAQKPKNQET